MTRVSHVRVTGVRFPTSLFLDGSDAMNPDPDYSASYLVLGTTDGRMIEYVDQLHEHFVTPTVIERGRYVAPTAPGSGAEMIPESVETYTWTRS